MLTDKQLSVYDKLFDLTNDNMNKSCKEMIISKDAFMYTVNSPERVANIASMCQMPKRAFYQASFSLILHRFPDDGAIKKYEALLANKNISDETFKIQALRSILSSHECRIKHGIIKNNIYQLFSLPRINQRPLNSNELNATNISPIEKIGSIYPKFGKLYNLYRKLPEGIRKHFRHMLGGIG